jgi:signal transduction histidine kinase
MIADYDLEIRRIARCLAEIATALESADGADERVRHTLALIGELVPYERCALLKALPGSDEKLFVVPPRTERSAVLHEKLSNALRLMANAEKIGRSADAHLTLPLIGLDEIIGVIRVEPRQNMDYDARHLRLLSVVAAQLGAYLTMLRLRDDEARRAEQLFSANQFQQRLVGIVSHDLRNPLAVIAHVATHLLATTEDKQQARAIERALRNAQRANRMISDLLDVTHARVSGDLGVIKRRIDLHTLLADVVNDAKASFPERTIELHRSLREEATGEWDPDRIAQLTTNLIQNAVQHGGKDSVVRVELRVIENDVTLAVHNRGPAIPAAMLPIIFDPFKQGEQRRRRTAGGGLGLGLYIVDQIVRAHHGQISVRSTEEDGTTFVVSLPCFASPRTLGGAQ